MRAGTTMSKRLRILNRSSQRKQRERELSTLCHLQAQGNCLCPALDGACWSPYEDSLATDRTRMKHRFYEDIHVALSSVRVRSAFHPWLRAFGFGRIDFESWKCADVTLQCWQCRENKSFGPNGAWQDGQDM